MLLSVSPALTFYLSHLFTRLALPRSSQDKPSAWQTFLVNAAGNATSTIILFPLILSKTKLQWRSPSGRKMYKSLLDVLRKTTRKNGYSGEPSQELAGDYEADPSPCRPVSGTGKSAAQRSRIAWHYDGGQAACRDGLHLPVPCSSSSQSTNCSREGVDDVCVLCNTVYPTREKLHAAMAKEGGGGSGRP